MARCDQGGDDHSGAVVISESQETVTETDKKGNTKTSTRTVSRWQCQRCGASG